jgi:hypothetical protein
MALNPKPGALLLRRIGVVTPNASAPSRFIALLPAKRRNTEQVGSPCREQPQCAIESVDRIPCVINVTRSGLLRMRSGFAELKPERVDLKPETAGSVNGLAIDPA